MDSSLIQQGIIRIMYLYLGLSVACGVSFYLCGMGVFDAITHMFTTVATGGYSTHAESIAYFKSPLIEWVCMLFMFLGGTSFMLMIRMLQGNWAAVKRNSEFKAYAWIIVVTSLFVTLVLHRHHGLTYPEGLRTACFQVVSIMTTTGYSTADFDLWVPAGQIVLLMLMISGACAGSTAGGVKLIRILVGVKVCINHIEKAFRARVVRAVRVNHKAMDNTSKETVVTYLVMAGFVGIIALLAVAVFQHEESFQDNFASVLSTLANIGPGFGQLGPTKTYAFLEDQTKYLLSLLMIIGRLEFYAIMVLFVPSFWRRFY